MKCEQSDFNFSVGDLLKSGDDYFLVLGKEVAFAEQYLSVFPSSKPLQLIHKGLLGKKSLALLHWMVGEYYTVYRNVMKYFLAEDVGQLLHKEQKKKKISFPRLASIPGYPEFVEEGQILVVFPDLWTMSMTISDSFREQVGVVVLSSSESQSRKDKAFWEVKVGTVRLLVTTHAELFQDFKDLQQIIVVDPHKWYYSNQQDPRYKTPDVLAKLAEIWGIRVQEVGV